MRMSLTHATLVIALGAFAAPVAAQQQQPGSPPAPQHAAPPAQNNAAQPGKSLTSPEQQRQSEGAMNTPSGQAGKHEPGANAKTQDQGSPNQGAQNQGSRDKATQGMGSPGAQGMRDIGSGPILVNGALNVPGAPKDTQTVPAKFSARNAALDRLPIMAFPLALTDEQRRGLAESVRAANAPVEKIDAKVTRELPASVTLHDMPKSASGIAAVHDLKYVRLADRILLVSPANRIVVGEVKN